MPGAEEGRARQPRDRDPRAVTARMTTGTTTWQPAATAALDALALAVLVVDRQGHILHANREAADLLDRPDGALSGQTATGGGHGSGPQATRHLAARQAEGRARLHALIQAACDGRPGETVGFLQLDGGGPDEPGVSVCVSPLVDDAAPGRALVVTIPAKMVELILEEISTMLQKKVVGYKQLRAFAGRDTGSFRTTVSTSRCGGKGRAKKSL